MRNVHPSRVQHWESTDGDGNHHRFRVLERVALNKTNEDLEVNVLEYWETKPNGKRQHFSWVTDLPVNRDIAMKIMRAGRARWRIENETFNTLKNAGYNLEHNFGHGDNQLSTVFASLMMLAFLIDQVEQRCCGLFRKAREKAGRPLYFWQKLRSLVLDFEIPDWEYIYKMIAFGYRKTTPELINTS